MARTAVEENHVIPRPTTPRRLWAAGSLLAAAGLVAWLVASGPGDPPKGGAADREDAVPAVTTPSAAPSSGPTGIPSPGSLDVVPVREVATEPAVPLTAAADFGTGVTLRILRIESVSGVARGVGEIEGPALRLTLRMSNDSGSAVSLESVIVDATTGADRTPAPTLSGPGAELFDGEIQSGGSTTGVYVFAVPEDARDRLRVTVSYLSGAPAVAFAGGVR